MKRAPMYMFSELLEVTSGSGRASLTTVRSISQHTRTHTHTHYSQDVDHLQNARDTR